MRSLADGLEHQLALIDRAVQPDSWASLAGRVALARTELGDPAGALELIEPAAEILSEERAPLEHGRLLVGAAVAHRALGDGDRAWELFTAGAQLLAGRAGAAEIAAARSNVGLTAAELGRTDDSLKAFDSAIADAPANDHRLLASLYVNRGQVHLANRGAEALALARADFETATGLTDIVSSPVQYGQARNGLGAVAQAEGDRAVAAEHFAAVLATFTPLQFPFQHAVASHNLGLALSDPDGSVESLRQALVAFETALTLFDPNRYRAQWSESFARAGDVDNLLARMHAGWTRDDHFASLLAGVTESERHGLARTRLGHIAQRPDPYRRRAFAALAAAALRQPADVHRVVLMATVAVLMELPEPVLRSGLAGQLDAHRNLDGDDVEMRADRALDDAIHALLHGPQRVRVRDMLDEMGWRRP